jgi:hypothetical protein
MASATWAMGVPASMRRQSRSRPWGVSGALRCAKRTSGGVVLASSPAHLLPEVSSVGDPYRVTNVRERNT